MSNRSWPKPARTNSQRLYQCPGCRNSRVPRSSLFLARAGLLPLLLQLLLLLFFCTPNHDASASAQLPRSCQTLPSAAFFLLARSAPCRPWSPRQTPHPPCWPTFAFRWRMWESAHPRRTHRRNRSLPWRHRSRSPRLPWANCAQCGSLRSARPRLRLFHLRQSLLHERQLPTHGECGLRRRMRPSSGLGTGLRH